MSTTLSSLYSGTMFKKCCPHYVEDFDRCAGITVCSVKPVMPDEWDTIYLKDGLPRVNSALAEADFIAKACLPRVNGLYDFISATRRNWSRGMMGSRRKTSGVLEYEPFIKAARKGPRNNQWWKAVYGGAAGGGEPVGSHKYVVTPLSSSIPDSAGWFFLEMQVFLFSKANDLTMVNGAGTVKKIEVVGSDLTIWVEAAPESDLPGVGDASDFDEALLTRGLVNVTDYESFCSQIPAINTRQDSYYWVGTTRQTLCDSEIQKEFIDRVLSENKLYQEYYHVDDVEYNRQAVEDYQMRQVENFFWGRALSDKQTHIAWDELPTITLDFDGLDLPDQDACVGRRANPIGIVNQLSECNRVIDLQGGRLDLVSHVFEQIYYMDQIRSENGVDTSVFEVWMNSVYANRFAQGMIAYYKANTQDTLRMNLDLKPGAPQEKFGFYWRDFVLDFPAGKTLRVLTHKFFDSWFDAFRRITNVDIQSQGNMIWFLDWSSMYQATIASASVVNTTGSIQDLAKISQDMACRMKTKRTSWRHNSHTFTNVVECPAASLMIQNVSMDIPKHDTAPVRIGIGATPWDSTLSC
jgi:hypothetical protein